LEGEFSSKEKLEIKRRRKKILKLDALEMIFSQLAQEIGYEKIQLFGNILRFSNTFMNV
jgi:hypothetical protein